MSDSPKHSPVRLDPQRLERLERERKARAEAEAKARREREAAERKRREEEARKRREEEARKEAQRRLDQARSDVKGRLDGVDRMARNQAASMAAEDVNRLSAASAALAGRIASATDVGRVAALQKEVEALSSDIVAAIERKQRDDVERQRIRDLAALGGRMAAVHNVLAAELTEDRSKFDAAGLRALEDALSNAGRLRDAGDPASLRPLVDRLEKEAARHVETVGKARAEWHARRQAAAEVAGEVGAFLGGLKADDVLMRWCGSSVEQLVSRGAEAEQAITDERFDRPMEVLTQVRADAESLVVRANEAQLKADQRDYIVNSMMDVLSGMGFVVGAPQEEHPGHPASAHILVAQGASGRGFSVSVPVEGDIMYDVDGFEMTAEETGGGMVRTCDEAEDVLEDMKNRMAEAFGIVTGELTWDGKPPERISKSAKDLPKGDGKLFQR
ncbi:hypothetical protein [Magnetospirillum sp. 15-1]|uniref:hypothetical protein n=1 Tax=Magnetospirillum sp. 15-1 TaxID=1979370 RepID=UPI00148221BA|nr:hypothetical protein [Magnetospirillum sp. 15-1]